MSVPAGAQKGGRDSPKRSPVQPKKSPVAAAERYDESRRVAAPKQPKLALGACPFEGQDRLGVRVCKVFPLGHAWLVISQGSVLDFEGDAIVNAANKGCIGGGGVDGAITRTGGRALSEAATVAAPAREQELALPHG